MKKIPLSLLTIILAFVLCLGGFLYLAGHSEMMEASPECKSHCLVIVSRIVENDTFLVSAFVLFFAAVAISVGRSQKNVREVEYVPWFGPPDKNFLSGSVIFIE